MGRERYRYCYVTIRRTHNKGSPIKVTVKRRFRPQEWIDEQVRTIVKNKEYGKYMAYQER